METFKTAMATAAAFLSILAFFFGMIAFAGIVGGCSYGWYQGKDVGWNGLGARPIDVAAAHAVVTAADTHAEATRQQLAIQREILEWCKKKRNVERPQCLYGMYGGGYGGMVGWGGWLPPATYQSDRTYYRY